MNEYVKVGMLLISLLGIAVALPGTLGLYPDTADEAFLKEVWGGWTGNGPCTGIGMKNCGGFYNGETTCHYDEFAMDCMGLCAQGCPSGPKNEYCAGLMGSCYPNHNAFCSQWHRRECKNDGGIGCNCVPVGPVLFTCTRTDC